MPKLIREMGLKEEDLSEDAEARSESEPDLRQVNHSYLSDSTGSRLAARQAG